VAEHADLPDGYVPQDGPSVGVLLKRLQGWSQERKAPESVGKDGFPQYSEDPFAAIHQELDAYLGQIPKPGEFWSPVDPETLPAGAALLNLNPEGRAQTLRAILVRVLFLTRDRPRPVTSLDRQLEAARLRIGAWFGAAVGALRGKDGQFLNTCEFSPLAIALLRSSLPMTAEDLTCIVSIVADRGEDACWCFASPETALRAAERFAGNSELAPELRRELEGWKKTFGNESKIKVADRKIFTRIKTLLGEVGVPRILAGEAWSNVARADLKEMPAAQRLRWFQLLLHCEKADASKPSQKWLKAANDLIESVGRNDFKGRMQHWFELVALPCPVHQEPQNPQYDPDPDLLIADANSLILKGLTWCCAGWKDTDVIRAVSRLAQVCFKKVPRFGARCPRVGNACLYSLSVTTTDEAAAELSRLNQLIKQPSARKLLGKSLDKAAELSGQTREDLEESTVPTYGLDVEGCLKQSFGDFAAEYRITGPDAFELLWRKVDGKPQKSIPAEVREKQAAELKTLKRNIQDIGKMLPAQRQRIERLLASEREWEFDKWRQRYLDHPLLAHPSRRLIWHFRQDGQSASGIWLDGKIVDVHDRPLDWISAKAKVRIWHPLGQDLETVSNWRGWMETHQVTQPFKQAHREIYILTDAERQTETYSNRFAAHILRQHQFAALSKERGWTYRLQGTFDSHNTPTLLLPQWNLAVEFWVDSPGDRQDTAQSGIFLHVATDQVRFCEPGGGPKVLSEVPALIFSEVMRDVDLFVGVCSIGNDPAWQDRGEGGQFGGYWHDFSFGDLSATAKTRREVLEKLLPRLKIAGKCSLQDKFLKVKGDLRTYKIHLGSGNIMMEPNDRYLCIVPARVSRDPVLRQNIFLPFEGDNTLAIILSKAFLLADDLKIKDETILHQIKPS
jgi:hypothetical protein